MGTIVPPCSSYPRKTAVRMSTMNKKALLALTLALILTASFIATASAEENPIPNQDGDDSPGAHQCPRDGYDEQEGPATRNGFSSDF